MPNTKNWVDFRHVRETVDFRQVLEYYRVTLKLRGEEQHHGFCPLPDHEGEGRSPSFSAHLGRRIFHCFGCQAQGNVIDFVALMERLDPNQPRDIRKAALLIQERFLHEAMEPPARMATRTVLPSDQDESPPQNRNRPHRRQSRKPRTNRLPEPTDAPSPQESIHPPRERRSDHLKRVINAPLDFELKHLDPNHPYLQQRGLTPETIQEFGLGFCSRGIMVNRIAIPLHDGEGTLIGYAGRVVDDKLINEKNSKYLLPGPRERVGKVFEFNKSAFLFNGHHVQAPVTDLIVVEGFFSVFHLHQLGWTNVVALMGNSCSPEQAELIVKLTAEGGRIWLMPDGDEGGIKCAESLLFQISPHRPVLWITLDEEKDPCDYTREQLAQWLDGETSTTPTQADGGDSNLKHIQMVSLRLVREKTLPYESRRLQGSEEVYDLFRELAGDLDREALWVVCMDAKGHPTCLSQVALGTLTGAPAHPREILKVAIMANAMSLVLVHNHPSGDPQPSPDDRVATATIREAAKLLGIKLLDHIIVGNGDYYSFRDQGDL